MSDLHPFTDKTSKLKARLENMFLSWDGVIFVSLSWHPNLNKFGVFLGIEERLDMGRKLQYTAALRELEWIDSGLIFIEKGQIRAEGTQRAKVS